MVSRTSDEAKWTIKDVASYLGLSKRTVQRLHASGELPAGKRLPGRAVRWEPSKIRAWFEKLPAANA